MPGLASRNSDPPIGSSPPTASTGSPDLTASEAGRSPMNPTSIRCAANPASTRGPLSNSMKLTLYGAPASAPDACSRVSRSCCWSPRFKVVADELPAAACSAAGDVAPEPAGALLAHAASTASKPASDTPPSSREMVCDMGCGLPLRGMRKAAQRSGDLDVRVGEEGLALDDLRGEPGRPDGPVADQRHPVQDPLHVEMPEVSRAEVRGG